MRDAEQWRCSCDRNLSVTRIMHHARCCKRHETRFKRRLWLHIKQWKSSVKFLITLALKHSSWKVFFVWHFINVTIFWECSENKRNVPVTVLKLLWRYETKMTSQKLCSKSNNDVDPGTRCIAYLVKSHLPIKD